LVVTFITFGDAIFSGNLFELYLSEDVFGVEASGVFVKFVFNLCYVALNTLALIVVDEVKHL